MPQTRRKTPFSGKKKKDQLLQKRQLKGKEEIPKNSVIKLINDNEYYGCEMKFNCAYNTINKTLNIY